MTKPELELGIEVINYTFEKLPPDARIRVVRALERKTRRDRWSGITRTVRLRAAKTPISQQDINRICEETRQQLYEKRTKSGN